MFVAHETMGSNPIRAAMIIHMQGKWSEEDICFLVKNYPIYGAPYCAKYLCRKKESVKSKADHMKIHKLYRIDWRYEYDSFSAAVINSRSYYQVARNIGVCPDNCGNRNTVKKYIMLYNLDISHFDNGVSIRKAGKIKKIEELLKIDPNKRSNTSCLRKRLIKLGLKLNSCEL